MLITGQPFRCRLLLITGQRGAPLALLRAGYDTHEYINRDARVDLNRLPTKRCAVRVKMGLCESLSLGDQNQSACHW